MILILLPPGVGFSDIAYARQRDEHTHLGVFPIDWRTGELGPHYEFQPDERQDYQNLAIDHAFYSRANSQMGLFLYCHWAPGNGGPWPMNDFYRIGVDKQPDRTAISLFTGDEDQWSNTNIIFHHTQNVDPASVIVSTRL